MLKKTLTSALAGSALMLALTGISTSASAGIISVDFLGENDCAGFFGGTGGTTCTIKVADEDGVLKEISPIIAKYDTADGDKEGAWELYSYYPTIDGSEFSFIPNNPPINDDMTGSWTYTPDQVPPTEPADPLVRFWTVKGGGGPAGGFRLYWFVPDSDPCTEEGFNFACVSKAQAVFAGDWSTMDGIFGEGGKGLSHIAFWDTAPNGDDPPQNGVPEPATLGLLGLGMLAMGALRRRKVALKG